MSGVDFSLQLIVAMDEGRVIGRDGGLPWHLSEDLRRFKRLTMGHPILMGRVTHESIGRALPGRLNVVITRREDTVYDGCAVAHSLDAAVSLAREAGTGRAFIIGGATIYGASLDRVDVIELTEVHAKVEGDTRFPALDPSVWREVARARHEPSPRNDHPYSFVTLHRRGPSA